MKKILIAVFICVVVFIIYLCFNDNNVYYLSIGDYLANGVNPYGVTDYGYADYIKNYLNESGKLEVFVENAENGKRMTDLINDINMNKKINVAGKEKTFQNVLIKADLITISIGSNDLLGNVVFNNDFSVNDLYKKLDQVLVYYDELFKLVRKYCKEEIVLIGIYNIIDSNDLDEFFTYANNEIEYLCNKYKINYINIYEEFKNGNYFPNPNMLYPNKFGYELISNKIIKLVNEKILKNT